MTAEWSQTASGGNAPVAPIQLSFDYSSDALSEIQAYFKKSGKVIVPLTVKEILDEQIAMKLA